MGSLNGLGQRQRERAKSIAAAKGMRAAIEWIEGVRP